MKNLLLGVLLGLSLAGNAAYALGITVEGIPNRVLIAAVIASGLVTNSGLYNNEHDDQIVKRSLHLADRLLAGK